MTGRFRAAVGRNCPDPNSAPLPDPLGSGGRPWHRICFDEEHGNVDDKLNDLINLIVKYVEPVYDPNLCNEFLVEIFQFEKDARDQCRRLWQRQVCDQPPVDYRTLRPVPAPQCGSGAGKYQR